MQQLCDLNRQASPCRPLSTARLRRNSWSRSNNILTSLGAQHRQLFAGSLVLCCIAAAVCGPADVAAGWELSKSHAVLQHKAPLPWCAACVAVAGPAGCLAALHACQQGVPSSLLPVLQRLVQNGQSHITLPGEPPEDFNIVNCLHCSGWSRRMWKWQLATKPM